MSFIGDIFGIAADAKIAKYNAQVQKDINKENQQWALAAEERERAYNSPVAQMQRLKDAGLNPNLIYGSGASTGTLNSRTTVQEAPQFKMSVLDHLRARREGQLQARQMDSMDIQNNYTAEQTEVAKANAEEARAKADIARHDADVIAQRPDMLSTESVGSAIGRDLYSGLKGSLPSLQDIKDKLRGWKDRVVGWFSD